jgi:hypothetical protein
MRTHLADPIAQSTHQLIGDVDTVRIGPPVGGVQIEKKALEEGMTHPFSYHSRLRVEPTSDMFNPL